MHPQRLPTFLSGLALCMGVFVLSTGCQTTEDRPKSAASKPGVGHTWYKDKQIAFQHDDDLHVEVVQDEQETLWVLRDYSKTDNFRAFTLAIRISNKTHPMDLAQRADPIIKDLTSGVSEDVQIQTKQTTTWQKQPALRIEATYRYVGGREVYVDHKGKERSTAQHPLDMHWTALLGHTNTNHVLITMDASKDHHDKRSPGLAKIIETLEIPPQGSHP